MRRGRGRALQLARALRGAALGALLGISGACRDSDTSVATLANHAPPFDSLTGVRLGMTAHELRAARPRIPVDSVYDGHAEYVPGYWIGYGLRRQSWTLGMGEKSLVSVSATLRPGPGFRPDPVWERLLADGARRFGTPPDCYSDPRAIPQNRLALWSSGDYRYYAMFVAPVAATNARLGGVADTIMGHIRVGVARRSTLLGGWELVPDQHPVPADCLVPRGVEPTPRSLRE